MAERLRAVDILDKPTCAGGVIKARAIDCRRRTAVFTTTGEDQFELEIPLSSPAVSYVTSRYVARVQYADAATHFHEWRFLDDSAHVKRKGGRIVATAYDLVNDLAAPGPIRTVDANVGIPTFNVSVEATATELIDNYILPRLAAKGYTWIARGTVEFTEKRLWEWQRLNPLELLRYICSVRGHEYRLRRNGSTNYLIDVVETINGNEPVREIRPGINLLNFRRTRKGASHFTVLEGVGATQQDGRRATIARAAWKVTAVDTGANKLTLADPSGAGPGPVIENDQYKYDKASPGYVFRYHQGGLHRIVASDATAQTVTLDSVAGYAVGDLVELRGAAGATGYAAESADGWTHANVWSPWRVTAIDTPNKRLTLDDPWASVDPIYADDRYRGWTARPYFRSASSSMSSNVAASNPLHRQCTVTSTTGMQAGDLCLHSQNNPSGAPDWTLVTLVAFEVVSVDSATLVTIKHRRKATAVGALTNSTFLSTWRPRSDRVCVACTASADTADVNDVTSIVVGDLIEFVRQYDGPVQVELASPAGVDAHGIRVGLFDRETRGERNLLLNPYFRDFTGGAHAAPDRWFLFTTTRMRGLKNTDPAYIRTGVNSLRLAVRPNCAIATGCGVGGTSVVLQSGGTGGRFEVGESVRLSATLGNEETVVLTSVSADGLTLGFAACANAHAAAELVRGVEQLTIPPSYAGVTLAGPGASTHPIDIPTVGSSNSFGVRVVLFLRNFAAGNTIAVKATAARHAELGGSDATSTVTLTVGTNATTDSWNEVWIPLVQSQAGGRLVVEVNSPDMASVYPQERYIYVAAVGVFQVNYEASAIPEVAFATELHQATNAKLALISLGAPASYDLGVVDCFGLDPSTWPYLQLIAGVSARLTEPAAGVVGQPLRIIKLHADFDNLPEARIEIGTKQQRLTEILANASVPVPIVQINADGSTKVLTGVSQQQLSFPTIGPVPPPTVTELFATATA